MIRVLFTDTHYGWKQNSSVWLESQLAMIDKQLIPLLKKLKTKDSVRLIHLGDVFESRSSISPMVAKAVRAKFLQLADIVDDFYIVAGNHDFYSPTRDDIESLSLVFRDSDIKLVINEIIYDDEDMFVPWYCYKDIDNVKRLLEVNTSIKNIYTHADIFGEDRSNIKNINIFSGHIHIPKIRETDGLYNIGSCYSLNFADSNQDRYIYVYDEDGIKCIPNKYSIKFWRFYNDQIFGDMHDAKDYYEMYIDQMNMQSPKYQMRLTELGKIYRNFTPIPLISSKAVENEHFESYDIEDICRMSIPKHLEDKFQLIESKFKNF